MVEQQATNQIDTGNQLDFSEFQNPYFLHEAINVETDIYKD